MPIYEYRCADCGKHKDHLQKLSDAPIEACPACGSKTYAKAMTAAGFQLKGNGWYATDFKSGGNNASKPASSATSTETKAEAPTTDSTPKADSSGSCSTGCACH